MGKLFGRRNLFRAAVVTIAAGSLMAGLTTAAQASTTGAVRTSTGVAVTVRAAPGTTWDAWTSVASGSTVTILCQGGGDSVTGYYGTTSTWYMISNGGFVTAAYVKAAATPAACTYSADPPRDNPRGRNSAISHAFADYHSTGYEGYCLKFVGQMYGWSYTGWYSAEVGGDWLTDHGYMHTTGIPPRGALTWYHNSAGTGHVALSLGEGKVISTSVSGSVGVASYTFHSSYRGWTVAYFPSAG